ncbi:response regulator transcription factor [Conexibacter stalactiti]|uniref:Response regulator transcription factor n=1 Tax=Conexibacter stalactiti TaxID=1940611 RepID=A0ABU4HNX9_9ACTN|nr:response regulator transcription factor [Conexibacter stalactiti]MDW5595006.1 response regulator transcription factor [Conexibacter stalactiti]MEC5035648.1 response regulator transcription factor [Conexibacter stalactiti]
MSLRSPVSVLIARFEDLVGRGLRALIDEDPNLAVVSHDVPHERITTEVDALRPQVALLNFGSLGSPIEVRELAGSHPATRLIVLANRPSPAECNQMLAFGATACLSKETQARDVLSAIHLASRGLHVLPRSAAAPADGARPVGPQLLTPREADVLEQLQRGRSNGEIAAELHVGVETVRTHARNIYRKLGVRSRRDLARIGDPAAP